MYKIVEIKGNKFNTLIDTDSQFNIIIKAYLRR